MNELKKFFNGYRVLSIIGFIAICSISHFIHREYIIGLFHGAGIFMVFFGLFGEVIATYKANCKNTKSE